ncbi:hypothetical protein DH2020_015903 [Rehmannia glutinosa]|uniref:Alpha-1,3-glucosyltransferase n=1 Tax=Rehmannia glutinosa TaxID=99300 RepID=A0ABR0WVJ3_REHGL
MFGDYEAQRHWMEITVNLPVKEWYRNSSANDLRYWGLDYPPLTAYQSYFHGILLKYFDPASVSLFTSRGYESYLGKLLMRWTVLMSDLMIFFPAVLYFVTVYYSGKPTGDKSSMAWHTVMILLNPCLILIDHGHFQRPCWLPAVLPCAQPQTGAFLPKMSAYYAPAFFAYLLGKCLRRQNPILGVLKLGLVVLGTFALVWWPYLYSVDASMEVPPVSLISILNHNLIMLRLGYASKLGIAATLTIVGPAPFLMVLSRLAPFERGIYEDYVANFWCTTSVLVKWKRLFTTQSLKLLSLAATVSTFLPSMIQLVWSPTKRGFLLGLLNCSFSFYLFSFQVHEKSILLPLLPASFLALEEPFVFRWLIYFALLSMFPLVRRDNLVLPYGALYGLFVLLYYAPDGRKNAKETDCFYSILKSFALACSLFLHVIYMTITPPDKYPFLFEAVIMMFCFSQFVWISIYLNTKQWALSKTSSPVDAKKKSL